MNTLLHWLALARLAHRGSTDALPWYGVLATALLGPLFYVLYFFFVRLGSIAPDQAPRTLLTALLLMPVGASVFGIATLFGRLRNWGVLRQILISRYGLFSFALAQTLNATAISASVNLIVLVPAGLFLLGGDLAMLVSFWVASIIASFALAMFGLACAMFILTMRDHLMVTNVLFFVVMLTSGVVDDLTGLPDRLMWINPVRPLVDWIGDTGFDGGWDHRIAASAAMAMVYLGIAKAVELVQMRRIALVDI